MGMENVFCPNCNKTVKLPVGAHFCTFCGVLLTPPRVSDEVIDVSALTEKVIVFFQCPQSRVSQADTQAAIARFYGHLEKKYPAAKYPFICELCSCMVSTTEDAICPRCLKSHWIPRPA